MEVFSPLEFFIRAFAGVFVILDPVGASAHFMGLCARESEQEQRSIARRACLSACAILFFFSLAGRALFNYFGITLAALKIAGGILLFTIALAMLHGRRPGTKTSPEEEKEAPKLDDVALIPLALPLLSGPGAITTVMVLASEAHGWLRLGILLLVIVLAVLCAYLIFVHSHYINKVLRQSGTKILTRIMGLIMSVIAVQFVVNGIGDVIPVLLEKVR